jgi:hypothetical protein
MEYPVHSPLVDAVEEVFDIDAKRPPRSAVLSSTVSWSASKAVSKSGRMDSRMSNDVVKNPALCSL